MLARGVALAVVLWAAAAGAVEDLACGASERGCAAPEDGTVLRTVQQEAAATSPDAGGRLAAPRAAVRAVAKESLLLQTRIESARRQSKVSKTAAAPSVKHAESKAGGAARAARGRAHWASLFALGQPVQPGSEYTDGTCSYSEPAEPQRVWKEHYEGLLSSRVCELDMCPWSCPLVSQAPAPGSTKRLHSCRGIVFGQLIEPEGGGAACECIYEESEDTYGLFHMPCAGPAA